MSNEPGNSRGNSAIVSGSRSDDAPIRPTLSLVDAVALIVGTVIGAGIFETPALVAANTGSIPAAMFAWGLGGAMSLVGALCYAELATAYPHPGGNYYYFRRAFGNGVAFLFGWARLAVIQTGSIVLLVFVFGDYASQLWRLGEYSSALYAAGAIALLTALNARGVRLGAWTQNGLVLLQVLGLLLIVAVGFTLAPVPSAAAPAAPGGFGLAMVFVLLTYGGWNEAAYISAELRDVGRTMIRALLFGLAIIAVLYLLLNFALLRGLGFAATTGSEAVAADLLRRGLGAPGAALISLIVVVTTLCSANATILTGARTAYALGRDYPLFGFLGRWQGGGETPTNALMVQGLVAGLLILVGAVTRRGFETMVEYTAPVFWLFFLLAGVALLVLRVREPHTPRPVRVPLYPLVPLLFCGICLFMLQASLAYTGIGALLGVAVLLVGLPLWLWQPKPVDGDR